MMRIVAVAGTRPEIIKLAPLFLEARRRKDVDLRLVLTGQHATMARETLDMFDWKEDRNLGLMVQGQSINHVAAAIFQRLPPVLTELNPAIVVVQGDTTSAAASALCAFHQRIPVAHVEAGLRSGSLDEPFPEEANRRIISVVARYNFAPTEDAAKRLLGEGVDENRIVVTGNTVVDALRFLSTNKDLSAIQDVDRRIRRPFVLVTAHRRESFGEGIKNICGAIQQLAKERPDVQFVYPVHLNPNVHDVVVPLLDGIANVLLLPPVTYEGLLTLLHECMFVMTDSGGIQEEAPSFGKYSIVLRNVTERRESVSKGYSELAGNESEAIVQAVRRQWAAPTKVDAAENPYGDGKSAHRILEILGAA